MFTSKTNSSGWWGKVVLDRKIPGNAYAIDDYLWILYNHNFTTPNKIMFSGNDYQQILKPFGERLMGSCVFAAWQIITLGVDAWL